MKNCKLFGIIALIAVIGLVACSSPAGGGDPATSVITMTTTESGSTNIYLLGTGKATIDWGDSTPTEEVPLTSSNDVNDLWNYGFPHTYSSGTKTLTVTGAVTGFSSCGNGIASDLDVSSCPGLKFLEFTEDLTTLDLSKNSSLEYLDCWNNQLTALDLSKNTKLVYLDCSSNFLTSLTITGCNALERVFCNDNNLNAPLSVNVLMRLPNRTGLSPQGYINVASNPGLAYGGYSAAKTYAQSINWDVDG